MHDAPQALLGLLLFPLIAWALGRDRRAVRPRVLLLGIGAQLVLGAILLWAPGIGAALSAVNEAVRALDDASATGARFMFGYLAGGDLPFEERGTGSSFIVAFRVLPLVLVVSSLSAVLDHMGIIPALVRLLAAAVQRVFAVSGPLAFGASASVFFGIIETPLLIRPWLARMGSAELFALMVCGMSTVAGTVMVLYAAIVEPVLPGALGQILVASLLSVPAALTISHAMVPGVGERSDIPRPERSDAGVVDALLRGTRDGTRTVVEIAATLVVLFALVDLANQALALWPAETPWRLQTLVGVVFRPLVWLAGIPWSEASAAADLMGTKTVLNEFAAYLQLAETGAEHLSPRSRRIMVTAMCGFANLGSLGILVGGLASAIPERRTEVADLAARAVVGGTLATLSTAAVQALLSPT